MAEELNNMQITSNEIANNKYMQIYLTKEELKIQEIQDKIKEYKKQKYKIGIFVTGKENYPEILKKIITKRVKSSDNVC